MLTSLELPSRFDRYYDPSEVDVLYPERWWHHVGNQWKHLSSIKFLHNKKPWKNCSLDNFMSSDTTTTLSASLRRQSKAPPVLHVRKLDSQTSIPGSAPSFFVIFTFFCARLLQIVPWPTSIHTRVLLLEKKSFFQLVLVCSKNMHKLPSGWNPKHIHKSRYEHCICFHGRGSESAS